MSAKILKRSIGKVDLSLPFEECVQAATEMEYPQKIVEDGVTYEAFDCRLGPGDEEIEVVAWYREVKP
jgi:hypothetical protein